MFTNLQATTFNHFGSGLDSQAEARRVSARLFERANEGGLWNQWVRKLFGSYSTLRSLSHQPESSNRSLHIVTIPVNKIVGSEGRNEDFDAQFRPLKKHLRERWIGIAVARRTGVILPAVELVCDGDEYYVRDGHHRISVAMTMGQVEIEARIVN